LYSAAPERRDQHPHSEEAKAFHDYVTNTCLLNKKNRNFIFLGIY
jgi:hypothetical protein